MKKITSIIAATFLLLGIASCTKTKDAVDELTEFDISYSNNVSIPASNFTTTTVPVNISTPDIPTNATSNFSSNKTASNLVSEIKMTKFNISTTGANLDFLKSVSIYLKTASLGETLIATKDNIPAGATSVSADLKDVNIKDYITKDNISFRFSFLFQSGSASNQDLKLDETVHVKATLLK